MPAQEELLFGQGGQLRSGFGKQALGNHPTAPGCDFGSSVRDATLKLYASCEHDKAKLKSSGGNQSMGAIYKVVVCSTGLAACVCVGKVQASPLYAQCSQSQALQLLSNSRRVLHICRAGTASRRSP